MMLSKPMFIFFCFFLFGTFLQADNHPKAFLGVDLEKNDAGQILITHVLAGEAAEKGGAKKGDVLIGINGKKYQSLEDVAKGIRLFAPGDKVLLHVLRDQKELDLEIQLGKVPASTQKKSTPEKAKRSLGVYTPIHLVAKDATLEDVLNQIFEKSQERIQYIALADSVLRRRLTLSIKGLGAVYAAQYACVVADVPFRTQMLTEEKMLFVIYPFWTENSSKETAPAKKSATTEVHETHGKQAYVGLDLAEKLTAEEKKTFGTDGVLVLEVIRFSPAEKAGFQKNDLLLGVGETPITSSQELLKKLAQAQPKETWVFKVMRQQKIIDLSVTFVSDPRFSGLLHREMKLRYDSTSLGDILEDIHRQSQEKFQFVASNEVLTRHRFSLRVSGLHLQLLLSHFLNLIDWEYELIQSSPTDHLMLITRPKSKG